MTTRYCSSCRRYRSPDNGESVRNLQGKVVRWRCESCKTSAKYRTDPPDLNDNSVSESMTVH